MTNDTTAADDANANADADAYDECANILSLQLRKPKHWRWELSTSRSCANIALPRILLYDHTGQLLVDANSQEEQCYSEQQNEGKGEEQTCKRREPANSGGTQLRPLKRAAKAATASLAHSIRKALDRQFSDLQIQEATPSPSGTKNGSSATTPITDYTQPSTPLTPAVDFYTNELPDYELVQRADSLKGLRFKFNNKAKVKADLADDKNKQNSFNLANLPTPPSTITTTTTPTNSSSSGPRAKRRYRRSHSSARSPATSESILERFSFNKGRFSSPEYVEEKELHQPQRYFLRTCKAGTLVLAHDSFSRYRRRRRQCTNSSTEHLQSGAGSGSKNSLNISDSEKQQRKSKAIFENEALEDSLWNVSEQEEECIHERKKLVPVPRYRSAGNVLRHRHSMSSDEDSETKAEHLSAMAEERLQRAQPKYGNRSKKQGKTELIIIDPENSVQPSADYSESR
ncbi:uncharacterized protein [Eurosta solidaginis]|uniref:uncharacterized protein n=1 Tax=Eurosta solidaginis TaxID=178769 RepID=UPI0035308304